MQNGVAAFAALRALRRFSTVKLSPGMSRYSSRYYSRKGAFVHDEGLRPLLHTPLHLQLCKRASVCLHLARSSNAAESSMGIELPSPTNHPEGNVLVEQVSDSTTLKEMNITETSSFSDSTTLKEMNITETSSFSESEPPSKSGMSSSSQLPVELCERLNHLENKVDHHSTSLTLLVSQLEAQRQLLESISGDIKRLKADPGYKDRSLPPASSNEETLDIVKVPVSSSRNPPAHPWPEWTHFMEHLKGLPFYKELIQLAEVAGFPSVDDPTTVKRILAKFSQAYDYIFHALPVTHVQILTDHGCPSYDRRTVASFNRLKEYFEMGKKIDSGGVASLELAGGKPKLADVIRIVYMFAELAKKDGAPEILEPTIGHLLKKIIKLTTSHKLGHNACSSSVQGEKVLASGEEDREAFVSASRRHSEMSNKRQATPMEELLERKGLLGAQEQVLQKCILSENGERFLGGDGVTNESEPGEHSDIFDDIFDQSDKSSSQVEPKKCSLSDLVRENKKAFSSVRKEKEQGIALQTDDFKRTGTVPSTAKGIKYHDIDGSSSASFRRVVQDDSDIEAEGDNDMRQPRAGGGRAMSNSSLGLKHSQSNSLAVPVGKGFDSRFYDEGRQQRSKSLQRYSGEGDSDAKSETETGRTYGNVRRMTKSIEWYSGGGDSDAESEFENFDPGRTYGNDERSKYKGSKHHSDRHGYSGSQSGSRGGSRRRKESSPRSW